MLLSSFISKHFIGNRFKEDLQNNLLLIANYSNEHGESFSEMVFRRSRQSLVALAAASRFADGRQRLPRRRQRMRRKVHLFFGIFERRLRTRRHEAFELRRRFGGDR